MKTDARHVLIEQITDRVSKGMCAEGRMSQEMEHMLRVFGISEHWIQQMKSTNFLRSKAKLINDTLNDLYYIWFRMQDINYGDDSEEEFPDDE